jgi:hypothetical protein
MADPLSPATRATKRNLLLASVLAISANAFNVSIDKIPVAGLSITFDDRLFAFLLFTRRCKSGSLCQNAFNFDAEVLTTSPAER